MIRLSVLYPSSDGAPFDHDYYRDHHVALAVSTWHPLTSEIDRGVDGPYVAAVHFTFDSLDTMWAALGSDASATVTEDVAKYTSITPVMQISEIV